MPPSPGSTNAKAQCLPADSCESPPKSGHELAPEPAPEVPHETGQSTRRVLRTDSGSATDPPWDATPPPTQQLAFSIGLPRTTTRSAPASPPTPQHPHFSPKPATRPAGLRSAPPTYLTLRPIKTT